MTLVCMPHDVLQFVQSGKATKVSDVFSFCVVMAEACSKVAPWIHADEGFAMNPDFPHFPKDSHVFTLSLHAELGCLEGLGSGFRVRV